MEGEMDLREFIFFDQADHVLFVRTDAESATWSVDEMNLVCLFPYDGGKKIERGMRIGFEDAEGVMQPFEVRKVRSYEPDNYQEITCEHIVISELTDYHTTEAELDNVTPTAALSSILAAQPSGVTGAARWQIGNATATDISSGDIGEGSVWQNVRTIEEGWNVYITPRVTWNANGITGRYLDIVPAAGIWHGVRLAIDKNMDEAGITVDDTEVKTALYGYGGTKYTITQDQLDKTSQKITLVGYTWANPPTGASKNTADGFIVDTAATAMYGRNGQPRFGFYTNTDITDQATLAQKTWETLQTTNKPTVTVDCTVRDLYRMGYHDEPIRLHDTVFIDLLPIHDVLSLEIVKLSVDLLDPTATRPTIGTYIPNIVYIQRQTADHARGGSSGRISGQRGEETEEEAKWSEFVAEFTVNNAIFSYHASQIDHDNKVLKAAGLDIDANGAIIYATDNVNMIGSRFNVQADKIGMVVGTNQDGNYIKTGEIVLAINNDQSTDAIIHADHVYLNANQGITLDGMVSVSGTTFIISDGIGGDGTLACSTLECDNIEVEEEISAQYIFGLSDGEAHLYNLTVDSEECSLKNVKVGTNTLSNIKVLSSGSATDLSIPNAVSSFGTVTESGGTVTIPVNMADNTTGTPITFNVAAMQYFIDSIAAAKLEGWNLACSKVSHVGYQVYGPVSNSYGNEGVMFRANYTASSYSASSHSHSAPWMKIEGLSGTYRSDTTVNLSDFTGYVQFNNGYDSYTPSSYSASSFSWSS